MGAHTLLQRRPTGYYFRQAVPDDLRPVLGKAEVVRSLGTHDLREAKRRVKEVGLEVARQFDQARAGLSLSPGRAQELVRDYWQRRVAAAEAEWRIGPTLDPDDIDERLEMLELRRGGLVDDICEGWLDAAWRDAAKVAAEAGLILEEGGPGWRLFASLSRDEEVGAISVMIEGMQGGWAGAVAPEPGLRPMHRQHHSPAPPRPGRPRPGSHAEDDPPLSVLFTKYHAERRLAPGALAEANTAVRRFVELHGDLSVKAITKAHVREFKDALLKLPADRAGRWRGKTVPERLREVAGQPDVPRLSAPSVKKCLGAVAAVLSWGASNAYLEANPAAGLGVAGSKTGGSGRLPYDAADLKALFERSPVFAAGARPRGGAGEAAFWLPLLALFTGARLEELGQLLVTDVREADGITYLDLNTEGEGKRLKTASSRRKVPLHPELIRCGFLAYVEARRRAGGGPNGESKAASGAARLFPELHPSTKGVLTASWSKWWGRYAREETGIADRRKVFHSFRHAFKDACRRAEIEEAVHDALTGHSGGGVGRSYGEGYPVAVLNRAVAKLSYPGLDLSHLYADRPAGAGASPAGSAGPRRAA